MVCCTVYLRLIAERELMSTCCSAHAFSQAHVAHLQCVTASALTCTRTVQLSLAAKARGPCTLKHALAAARVLCFNLHKWPPTDTSSVANCRTPTPVVEFRLRCQLVLPHTTPDVRADSTSATKWLMLHSTQHIAPATYMLLYSSSASSVDNYAQSCCLYKDSPPHAGHISDRNTTLHDQRYIAAGTHAQAPPAGAKVMFYSQVRCASSSNC
jgi:hypothetical protein